MLKTNSKQVRQNVRAYILSHFEPYPEDAGGINTDDFSDVAMYICNTLYEEYRLFERVQMRRFKTVQNAFVEWCRGLPTILDTCYYYNRSAVDDLGDILDETPEERSRFSEEQAEDLLSRLMYLELTKCSPLF